MGYGGSGKGWGGWGGWGGPMMWVPYGKGWGKGGGGKGWGRRRAPRIDPSLKIWIGNIAEGVTWKDLQTLGNTVAPTKWVEVFKGKGKGTGMIAYKTPEEVAQAMAALRGQMLGEAPIEIDAWEKAEKEAPA
mmetsp:Transcript_93390/g.166113  ORF Transcript_93390/g.166113 Transcript_93390/m.166113 type:complete len:132 (+) Transcript_93390:74-469(+)|eukprot:CAMPEP_0197652726 /NCGR_PEP_ID=MMETSP1338-20131121/34626_1 /TAXON_ID=43686 ORGANISM="Pelagodinium beii, Strain RCC1491" /NCGR_SAMPLE_ID=MMETSP1338 /ASSEMBLY_ACC=CAM_ASM_000754 /LENGTH=131 /DNA_ID=CAMNT_0043227663 /DNA_START=72 /DNA_END=467 /DNA_ORIENTATION=+